MRPSQTVLSCLTEYISPINLSFSALFLILHWNGADTYFQDPSIMTQCTMQVEIITHDIAHRKLHTIFATQ
jgi:hypothetical protein